MAFINLRFPSGVVANVNVSWLSPVKLRRTIVVGSKKMLLYDDTESVEKVKVFDHGVDFERPRDFGEFQLSYRTGDIVAPKLEPTEPLFAEAAHFVDCITSGDPAGDRWRIRAAGRGHARSRRSVPQARRWRIRPFPRDRARRPESGRRPACRWTSTSPQDVLLGRRVDLQAPCIIGKAPRGRAEGELALSVGAGSVVRPFTTIYAGSRLGAAAADRPGRLHPRRQRRGRRRLHRDERAHGIREPHRRPCAYPLRIFDGVVTIEDDVFVGPNVVFTDDPHPMNCPRYHECRGGAIVRRLARIGANCTIMPGVEIGEDSLVGAGSVVIRDVPAGMVVAGNPARVIKAVAELECPPGWFERPYVWEPYERPEQT